MQVIKINEWHEIPNGYTGIVEWDNDVKWWFLNGKPHREDGPAVEFPDGEKQWFLNGLLHREDGPAVEFTDGDKVWYSNGHRLFSLLQKSQPFVLLEEFVDEEDKEQLKILTQKGIEIWPNLPGLKELADSWEMK
jgi:hypothetical protein